MIGLTTRQCTAPDCDEWFQPTSDRHKYCTAKCRYRTKDAQRTRPCSGCGKSRPFGRRSLPGGELTCWECRRLTGPKVPDLASLQVRYDEAICAGKTLGRGRSAQKGLGRFHQQAKRALCGQHTDGSPCDWCGRPMWLDPMRNWDYDPQSNRRGNGSLQADHTIPRKIYLESGLPVPLPDRLLHGRCNNQRGDGRNDHLAWINRRDQHPIGT